jgi:H(+)-translocating pyrophosphatase
MGADLFGSLAESTCAALVVSSTSYELIITTDALYFPLMITAAGICASFLSVLLVHVFTVTVDNVQNVLKAQLAISTALMTVALIPLVYTLPETFNFPQGFEYVTVGDVTTKHFIVLNVSAWVAYGCICFGLWSGMIIGFTTEYYTSNVYGPTLALTEACGNGPAPNIILGLALGYNSCIIPILCITATIGYAFTNAGMYGIGLSALGMLGSLPVALTIDGYGPISDNAGGIAAMSGLPSSVRDQTDALDAAGNTTAAVGKGFAIGSACLVGLALFGAFNTRVGNTSVDILQPISFCGLLVGAMLPYAFSALTMAAVGDAANEMMNFILADFTKRDQCIKDGTEWFPDYQGCIKISTDASLKKMVAPGALVLGSPLLAGFVLGPEAVSGLLAGAIVSGVQVAISASNTGGAWDNAKKECEKRRSTFLREAKAANINLDEAVA